MKNKKNILVAAAWPYANGSLHLGHIASFIGADILARYHRLRGDDVLFVSGSDCHGTPIVLEALSRGVSPASIAEQYHGEFRKNLLEDLRFSYDIYAKTTDPGHTRVVQDMFLKLYDKGHIYTKEADALYSPELERFLPDRFVEGVCPQCGYDGARGDQCDECGSLLDALQLQKPRVSKKAIPNAQVRDVSLEVRKSTQFYLRLSAFEKDLAAWVEQASGSWRPYAEQFTKSFLKQGLHDRAITRDTDWGVAVPVPGYEDKKIYVWFEAVLGYVSASQQGQPDRWQEWWKNEDALHYYVHGKDNVPFHTVILPAILMGHGDLHLPDTILATEYLSLEGKQFSTSRSHAVWVPEVLEHFDSELLRYFLVVQGTETSDIDFRWSAFAELVNGELIGTFGNFVNRVCLFTKNHFPDGVTARTSVSPEAQALWTEAEKAFESAGTYIERGMFRKAFREVLRVAEHGNKYMHTQEPWVRVKENKEQAETDLFVLLHCIHSLALLIAPFLPKTAERIHTFLQGGATEYRWEPPAQPVRYTVSDPAPLFQKVTDEEVEQQKGKLGLA